MPLTPAKEPCFLVGAHRSGTTLLGLMLDSHPDLSWFHHFEWAVKHISADGSWPTVAAYQEKLAEDAGYLCWNLSVDQDAASYPDVLNGFFRQRRERDRKPYSGATIHTRYSELPKIWPHSRFIHIVRDPRDTARSAVKEGWSGIPWGAAKRWQIAETEWDLLCEQVPEDRRLLVTFEELMANPVEILQKISAFLGIVYTDQMFSYIERTPYTYPNPQMASKWELTMPPAEVAMVELAVGPMMEKRGYQRKTEPKPLSGLTRVQLDALDRWKRFQWRVKRYGLKLWAAQFLARRLGEPTQLAWAIREVKNVDDQLLKASNRYVADPNLSSVKS